jgi:hypothetical protein
MKTLYIDMLCTSARYDTIIPTVRTFYPVDGVKCALPPSRYIGNMRFPYSSCFPRSPLLASLEASFRMPKECGIGCRVTSIRREISDG